MRETNTKKKIKKEGTLAKHKSDISKMKLSSFHFDVFTFSMNFR